MSDGTDATPNALTIPLNEDGTIGTLPAPLQSFFESKLKEAMKRAAQNAKPDPLDMERLKALEDENQRFKVADAERDKRYEEALKLRDERHAQELAAERQKVEARHARLLASLGADVRAEAIRLGAREDALPAIEALLRPRLALSETLDPVVIGPDGKPSDSTIAALVQETLDHQSFFRKAPAGSSGGARGGSTLSGRPAPTGESADVEAALDGLAKANASTYAIEKTLRVLDATRDKRAAAR